MTYFKKDLNVDFFTYNFFIAQQGILTTVVSTYNMLGVTLKVSDTAFEPFLIQQADFKQLSESGGIDATQASIQPGSV